MDLRPRNETRCFLLGLILAVMALLSHVDLGATAMGQLARLQAVSGPDFPICHSEPSEGTEDGAPADHERHAGDHGLCPLCQAVAAIGLLAPPPSLSPPHAKLMTGQTLAPPARAPPIAPVLAATYPTGPPDLA